MPFTCYVPKVFRGKTLGIIEAANDIIDEYTEQGFTLTLRQLYYQFVARALLPNSMKSYKRLGNILNDARLAGMVDWDSMEDRTRNLDQLPTWKDAPHLLRANARHFRRDRWSTQNYWIEVWVEKEALSGVFAPVCKEMEVGLFSCRGYPSQSEVLGASGRFIDYAMAGQETVILHFGDHDPSGIDMTRDIRDRLHMFEAYVEVHRMALNLDQIEEHDPPPNPAKLSDSRSTDYIRRFGSSSWELDALDPQTLSDLVRDAVDSYLDHDAWQEAVEKDEADQKRLRWIADNWKQVAELTDKPNP